MDLPITEFREDILDLIYKHKSLIVTADTGAGKSTQLPQFLLDAGFKVVVTQPRRLAARSVAARVAEERGEKLGETVGYHTAVDGVWSDRTRLLYCTDGLQLVRELMGHGSGYDVLVLDEVHEWNLNMEVLMAWAKRRLKKGRPFRLVSMSATVDDDALARYLPDSQVLRVPGRAFEVTELGPGRSIELDAAQLLKKGRNVLVFQPGKAEIEKTTEALLEMNIAAKILPLHGELTPEQQQDCFRSYDLPKCVVATNVAQTSITIPDIDAVIDSGFERRIELDHGVEGLYTRPISLADRAQRKGRAGRTKPGIFIDHYNLREERPAFGTAEIRRVRLDQAVLRLAEAGVRAEELEFFHQPRMSEIKNARHTLIELGCMLPDGTVTPIGQRVARLPVSAHVGRMIVEAEKLGVVKPIIRVAAILEAGFLGDRQSDEWRKFYGEETDSDCLAQLKVYYAAGRMATDEEREANGIHLRRFARALDIVEHIEKSLKHVVSDFSDSGSKKDILKSICAGMVDRIYTFDGREYSNGDGPPRRLSKDSVAQDAELVVGIPFDLNTLPSEEGGGGEPLHLLTFVTRLDTDWLAEIAPDQVKLEPVGTLRYDWKRDAVVTRTRVRFRQWTFKSRMPSQDLPANKIIFRNFLADLIKSGEYPLPQIDNEYGRALRKSNRLAAKRGWSLREIKTMLDARLGDACSLKELPDPQVLVLS